MNVRQVSNAGIILENAGYMIGVDVFTKDQTGIYPDLPETLKHEIFQLIKEGRVSALFFTHEHGDHFFAEDVYQAWKLHNALMIFSTEAVVSQLKVYGIPEKNLIQIPKEETKIASLGILPFGEDTQIAVKAMNAIHEGEQFFAIQNVVFLMEIIIKESKYYLAVTGDAMPQEELYAKISNWSKHVDWLFVPFPCIGRRMPRKAMEKHLQVKNLLVLHAPRRDREEFVWIEKTKIICERAKDSLPYPVFLCDTPNIVL